VASEGEAARPATWRRLWPLAFVAVAAAVVWAIVADYGMTWDESVQSRYGDLALDYFRSGLRDRSYDDFWNLRYYGALFEMLASGAARLFPAHALEARHACIAATAIAAVLGAVRFAGLLEMPLAPVFACLALATLPPFFGNAFQNSKDVPFAAAFAWSLVALAVFYGRERPRWRDAFVSGLAVGVALAVRVGGVVLFAYVAAGALHWWALGGRGTAPAARRAARIAAQTALLGVLAWTLMVATWPFAHEAPIRNPLAALSVAAAFPVRFPVLFEGAYAKSDALPGRYLAELIALKTPIAVLALGAVGFAVAIGRFAARPRSRAGLAALLVVGWVALPVVSFALLRPPAYDGLRHFLFVLPGVAILAAIGAERAVAAIRAPALRRVAVAAAALVLLSPIADLIRLHPYEMAYFNPLAGGVARAWKRYDTDYWVASYREAMEWIAGRVADGRRATVVVAATDYSLPCAERYAPPNVEVRALWEGGIDGPLAGPLPAGVDYYVATTRVGLAANFAESPIVHAVGRDGAVFTVVRASHDDGSENRTASR